MLVLAHPEAVAPDVDDVAFSRVRCWRRHSRSSEESSRSCAFWIDLYRLTAAMRLRGTRSERQDPDFAREWVAATYEKGEVEEQRLDNLQDVLLGPCTAPPVHGGRPVP